MTEGCIWLLLHVCLWFSMHAVASGAQPQLAACLTHLQRFTGSYRRINSSVWARLAASSAAVSSRRQMRVLFYLSKHASTKKKILREFTVDWSGRFGTTSAKVIRITGYLEKCGNILKTFYFTSLYDSTECHWMTAVSTIIFKYRF